MCESCTFENESEDRFCGGCGAGMHHAPAHAKPGHRTELSDLFTTSVVEHEGAELPGKCAQSDLDRLFGAAS